MHPLDGSPAVVCTDPVPGFNSLTEEQQLKYHRITIDLGHAKNCNKNPVAREFESKLLRRYPLGGPMSLLTLVVVTANLNGQICSCGLSPREMWTQWNQFSNHQIPLHNQSIIIKAERTMYCQPHPQQEGKGLHHKVPPS